MNPLPSPATSSSSSGELHLYIDSDTSSPTVPVEQQSSSQELLQGTIQVPQPPPLFSSAHTAVSTTQPPIQPTHIPSWADEVATAEQSVHSTPVMVVSNWAYSSRIRGPRPRLPPLFYPSPMMPTLHTQRPPVPSPRYSPALPPLRPEQSFPQPPPYDRPTSIDNYPCTDLSPRSRPRATAHEIYPVCSSPIQASQSPARHTASPPRGPQPSSSLGKSNPFAPTHGIPHRSNKDPSSDSTSSQTLSALIPSRVYTCQRELAIPPPLPQHTLKPTASSCSLGQLGNEYVREGRNRDLPLECLHFPINSRLTERFWHLSKYFFALADRPNDYLNAFSLATLHPTKKTPNTTPSICNLVFYIQHCWM